MQVNVDIQNAFQSEWWGLKLVNLLETENMHYLKLNSFVKNQNQKNN